MRFLSICRTLLRACLSRRGPVQRGRTFSSPLTAFSRPVKSAGFRTGWVPGRFIISRSSWELQAGRCRETSPPARSCHPTAPGCLPQARVDLEHKAAGARTPRFTQPWTERLSPQGKGSLGSGAEKNIALQPHLDCESNLERSPSPSQPHALHLAAGKSCQGALSDVCLLQDTNTRQEWDEGRSGGTGGKAQPLKVKNSRRKSGCTCREPGQGQKTSHLPLHGAICSHITESPI